MVKMVAPKGVIVRIIRSRTARKMLQQIAKTAAIILIDRGLGGRKQRR